uniref:Ribonuclease H-like domain-containing protein n=1 Tax=Tanacetum cinerariifolium TaxID=118510 RepID=A0A6L2KCW1_TANCI|nr:ribonuclease H-like domain-containing protein [Tanacetum cinerariifolium]
MEFLMGLNDVYQPIRSLILAKDPLPNVKDTFYIVSREESYRGLHLGVSFVNKSPHAAFVIKTNNNPNNLNKRVNTNNNKNVNRGPNPNLLCQNCGLIGHIIERCYELIGYRVRFKRNLNLSRQYGNTKRFTVNREVNSYVPSTSGSLSASFTNEQMMKLLNLLNEKPTPSANMSGWIINFGANQHMTDSTKYMFNVVDIYNLMLNVGHPNGKLVGTGSETGGLYLFDVNRNGKFNNSVCKSVLFCRVSRELWHCRLGHPADQVLYILGKKLSFSKNDHISPWEICHKAKQTREPFPLSDHKSESVGDIVHCDVWGPYKVVSYEASQNPKWVKALNLEMEALHRNNTFVLADLPPGRKAIRCVKEKNVSVSNIEAVKDGAVPSVTFGSGNTQEKNVGYSSTSPFTSESGPNVSFASLLKGESMHKGLNFRTLITQAGNRADVAVPLESIRLGSERHANSAYGFFLGKRVAYLVVAKYARNTWGSSYARSMIEIQVDVELQDTIVVAMPKLTDEGFYTCTVHVKYEWKPPRCACCKVFGHIQEECSKNPCLGVAKNLKKPSQAHRGIPIGSMVEFKPTKEYRPISKKPTTNTSNNTKKVVEPTKEVSNSNPFDALNLVDNNVEMDTNGGGFKFGYEDEVELVNNDMARSMASERSKNDSSLYVKNQNGLFIAIIIYVDDIVVTRNSGFDIDKFKKFLSFKFMIADLGLLKYFLESHFLAALRVFRYLKNAPGTGIQFYKGKSHNLYAYSDVDWANSAIQSVVNLVFQEKTKHFEIDLYLIREKVSSDVIKTLKVASTNNVAYFFTKSSRAEANILGLYNLLIPISRVSSQ